MSNTLQQIEDSECSGKESCGAVELIIEPREKDLGGFSVRRVLPFRKRRMVGPFVFFDHIGPATFEAGQGIDVRPHPHIGLATVTYLFEGEIMHRDSLGYVQAIEPGAINLMTAGSGIVHSERTGEALRASGHRLHGLQLWVALPDGKEEIEPSFQHYPDTDIPEVTFDDASVRVMIGEAYGASSPVVCHSPSLYVEIKCEKGASLVFPEAEERALYVVSGAVALKDTVLTAHQMAVLDTTALIELHAQETSHCVLIGGAPVGKRHMFWNFVSSSEERIEQAKSDWQEGRFERVPGEEEWIPLPE